MLIGIYRVVNRVNGKSYVGQSVNITRRFNAHRNSAFNPNSKNYNNPLYEDMRKYGIENFDFEILEECERSSLDEREVFYIAKFRSNGENGYNRDSGGSQAPHYIKLSPELVLEIIERLKTSSDNSNVIGNEFGVTGRTIRSINSGQYCRIDNEQYPIRPSLSKLPEGSIGSKIRCKKCGKVICKNKHGLCLQCLSEKISRCPSKTELENAMTINGGNFVKVGQFYGVTDNAVRKWCKSYGMPCHSRDYKIT